MYCCPKGGAFLRSIALKGWKSTKKLPSLAVPLNSDHQCFCMRCMSLCVLSTVWKVPIGKHASRCNWNALYAVLTFSSLMQNSTAKRFSIWAITRLPNLSCHAGITVAGTVGLSTISVSYPLFTSISWYCELVLLNFSSFFDRITKRYTFWQWIRQNTTTAFFHKFDTFLSKYIAF